MRATRVFYSDSLLSLTLNHYGEDSQTFELVAPDLNQHSPPIEPESAMLNMLHGVTKVSPWDVETTGQTFIKPADINEAKRIEDIVTKADEKFSGIVFFKPVSFEGSFSESKDWNETLESMHLLVQVTGAIIYSRDGEDHKPRLLLSTDTF
jgi:hypothetical protein